MDLYLCFEGPVPAQITQVSLSSCSFACANHNSLLCKLCPYHLLDLSTPLLFLAANGFFPSQNHFWCGKTPERKAVTVGSGGISVCMCIVCLFFSTFPRQTTSSSEMRYLSLVHSIHRHSKNTLRVAYALSHLDSVHAQYFKFVGSSPQWCTELFTTQG